jgi:hypothetical protein
MSFGDEWFSIFSHINYFTLRILRVYLFIGP